jgi:hypothetical protein
MVAIKNNRKSPVFEQVDYGVVEDCREFIPVLVKKLQENYKLVEDHDANLASKHKISNIFN